MISANKKLLETESELKIVEPSSTPYDFDEENNNIAKYNLFYF